MSRKIKSSMLAGLMLLAASVASAECCTGCTCIKRGDNYSCTCKSCGTGAC